MRRALLTAVLVTLACGGTDVGTLAGSRCQVALAGGVTASYSCILDAVHDDRQGRTGIALTAQGTGTPIATLDFEIDLGTGDIQPGTYGVAYPGSAKTAIASDTQDWLQVAHVDTRADQGSYTLVITSAIVPPGAGVIPGTAYPPGTRGSNPIGTVWRVHGTLDATLPPLAAPSTAPAVTVHATF